MRSVPPSCSSKPTGRIGPGPLHRAARVGREHNRHSACRRLSRRKHHHRAPRRGVRRFLKRVRVKEFHAGNTPDRLVPGLDDLSVRGHDMDKRGKIHAFILGKNTIGVCHKDLLPVFPVAHHCLPDARVERACDPVRLKHHRLLPGPV
jgi:hypothetical protein